MGWGAGQNKDKNKKKIKKLIRNHRGEGVEGPCSTSSAKTEIILITLTCLSHGERRVCVTTLQPGGGGGGLAVRARL